MKTHSNHSTRRSLTIFLQAVVVLIGIGILAFLLWEPHVEGVNAKAAFFEVYFDPFVLFIYAASIPFFVSLYQALKLLRYIGVNDIFSPKAVKALHTIKYCAFITACSIIATTIYIRITAASSNDDPAGFIMLGLITTLLSIAFGSAAAIFERMVQNIVDIQSENDLTV